MTGTCPRIPCATHNNVTIEGPAKGELHLPKKHKALKPYKAIVKCVTMKEETKPTTNHDIMLVRPHKKPVADTPVPLHSTGGTNPIDTLTPM